MSFNYARTERTFFDDELKGHFDRLEGMGPDKAEVSLVSKTRDDASWVVSFRRDDGPTEYSLYDTASHKLTPLFVSQPALSDYKFAHMEDVRIQARDGLELVAYLTRAKADTPTPLVLCVHGGPCVAWRPTRRLHLDAVAATPSTRCRAQVGQRFLGLQQRRAVVREPGLRVFTGQLPGELGLRQVLLA